MKNVFKCLGITTLVAVIIFSMAACNKTQASEKQKAQGAANNGGITKLRLSNVPVTGASSSYDFGYIATGLGEISPLSYFFTGTPKAIVNNGKLTLELDEPKSDFEEMQPLIYMFYSGISATPNDAKGYRPSFDTSNLFDESTNSYGLTIKGAEQGKDENGAFLLYVDKDVTMNGSSPYYNFDNIFLTKGWNFLTYTYSNETNYVKTASQTLPAGYVWTVVDHGIFKAPRDDVPSIPNIWYAETNLRLRSEPDTSKDNRIASVPQGSRVELLEVGKFETIDNIKSPWYKVKTADGTVGWLFSGYLTDKAPNKSYNYEGILNKDFSDFAGYWKNSTGKRVMLGIKGVFGDGQTASGFARQNNPKQASGGDFYMWGVNAEGGGFAVALFPIGVDVMGYEGIIPTDKTKVRLTMGQDLPSSSADVFYME